MSLITTGFHITWNGNSSKAVTAYSLTSAAEHTRNGSESMDTLRSNDNATWTKLVHRLIKFLQQEKKKRTMR